MTRTGKIAGWILLSLCIVAFGTTVFSEKKSSPPPSEAPPIAKLEPEQVIQFKGQGFACTSKEVFQKAIEHAVNKEKTKFAAMFERMDCIERPQNVNFKILSIDRHIGYDLVEIVNAKNTSVSDGMWTNWDYPQDK